MLRIIDLLVDNVADRETFVPESTDKESGSFFCNFLIIVHNSVSQ